MIASLQGTLMSGAVNTNSKIGKVGFRIMWMKHTLICKMLCNHLQHSMWC